MTAPAGARLLVLTTEELASGYRLAGAATTVCADATDVAERLAAALDAGIELGVIAVHEPFFAALEPGFRRHLERTLPPLVVALPAGEAGASDVGRRERLLKVLWQAVGYQITFDADRRA